MKRSMKLFERLLDTDLKADVLTLFHNNPNMSDTADELARKIGRNTADVQRELEDLSELGILKKVEVYSFGLDRDREIQDAISKQLALGEIVENTQSTVAGTGLPRIRTGLEVLDKVLPDGLPTIGTVLLLSDPGSGEESLIAHIVSRQVQAGKPVVYVTLDNFPANIRQIVQSQITSETVDWSSLIFIDCYSKTVGVESDEPHVEDPENLSAISIAISDVMSKKTISLIVLDSFNTLIRRRGVRSAIEFLRVMVARARQAKCLSLVTMNRKAFHPAMVASGQDVVDAVIELKIEESNEGIARSLRILKMIGIKHLTTWTPYDISDEGKFVLSKRATGTPSG
ncbi:MAG TPA: RAD55 family ATPase [Candidatus Bathyarchaeia archaeon]|nr:RAD55 family ATPase [Candidatus Bathyarchaeia archaeon]